MQSPGGATQVGVCSEVRGHIRPWISLAVLLRAVLLQMHDFSHGPTHFYFYFLKGDVISDCGFSLIMKVRCARYDKT